MRFPPPLMDEPPTKVSLSDIGKTLGSNLNVYENNENNYIVSNDDISSNENLYKKQ